MYLYTIDVVIHFHFTMSAIFEYCEYFFQRVLVRIVVDKLKMKTETSFNVYFDASRACSVVRVVKCRGESCPGSELGRTFDYRKVSGCF